MSHSWLHTPDCKALNDCEVVDVILCIPTFRVSNRLRLIVFVEKSYDALHL